MISGDNIKNIFREKLDLSGWEKIKIRENYSFGGIPIPGLRQEVHVKENDGCMISVGIFYYNNVLALVAWGPKSDVHCAFHAALSDDGRILKVREGCPLVQPISASTGEVTGFILDGTTIF